MVLLSSSLISVLLVFYFGSFIKLRAKIFYWFSIFLALLTIALTWSGFSATVTGLSKIFLSCLTQGGLAGSLFILVMYGGALPNSSTLMKKIMGIRAELSISASILTLGHNIAFGKTYFVKLFTQPTSLRLEFLLAAICSCIMVLIMLPLFITSFRTIRKRFSPKTWKKLQRCAYIFYGLMYVHVVLVNLPGVAHGKWEAKLNFILYTLVFAVYLVLRLSKVLVKHKKENLIGLLYFFVITFCICGFQVLLVNKNIQTTSVTNGLSEKQTEILQTVKYVDGEYRGSAIGYNGKLRVNVKIENGKISDIQLLSSVEDEPYLTSAIKGIFTKVKNVNHAEVDTVSGATTTADALKSAIEDALNQARGGE